MPKARALKTDAEHVDPSPPATPMRLASAWMADLAKAKYGVTATIESIKAGNEPRSGATAAPARAGGKH
jgi:hypothetical protein